RTPRAARYRAVPSAPCVPARRTPRSAPPGPVCQPSARDLRGRDVVVALEQVGWIVPAFHLHEAIPRSPWIRFPHPFRAFVAEEARVHTRRDPPEGGRDLSHPVLLVGGFVGVLVRGDDVGDHAALPMRVGG